MVESIARITLDVQDLSTSVTVSAKHGDTGRKIVIALSDGGFLYEIGPDCYAVLTAEKPDGSILFNHCDIEGNCIVYAFTEQTTAVVGVFPCEVKLYGADDALITAARFRIIVDGTIYRDNQVESKDEVSALTHLLSEATEVINTGNKLNEQGQLAIQEVQTATQEAILVTEQAEQASTDADESAESARAAALEAELVTERTNQAIRETQTATQEAINAASAANSAADRAQGALVTVEQAAKTAAEMAEDAEQAVKDAEIAIKGAEKATTAANAAADRANAASVVAYQANEKVDTLREVVSKLHSNIVETASGEVIRLSDASDLELAGLKVYGKTIQNGTPTPDAPAALESVGDSGTVTVTASGKNMLKITATDGYTWNGITIYRNQDGSITLDGPSSAEHSRTIGTATLPAGNYRLTGIPAAFSGVMFWIYENDTKITEVTSTKETFTLTKNTECAIRFYFPSTVKFNMKVFYPMLRLASITDSTYEPYKEPTTATVTPVDSSGNSLYLPGIPVTSGGNYTDPVTNKQWICDEVDFEKGQYIQRVKKITFDGTEAFGYIASLNQFYLTIPDMKKLPDTATKLNALCSGYQVGIYDKVCLTDGCISAVGNWDNIRINNFAYTEATLADFKASMKGVTFIYELATPIYHDINPAELAQYDTLHTNYPNTTVFNDAGAHMEVSYIADTQKYVDKKFEALEAAIASLI